jgi:hypothetical protein
MADRTLGTGVFVYAAPPEREEIRQPFEGLPFPIFTPDEPVKKLNIQKLADGIREEIDSAREEVLRQQINAANFTLADPAAANYWYRYLLAREVLKLLPDDGPLRVVLHGIGVAVQHHAGTQPLVAALCHHLGVR